MHLKEPDPSQSPLAYQPQGPAPTGPLLSGSSTPSRSTTASARPRPARTPRARWRWPWTPSGRPSTYQELSFQTARGSYTILVYRVHFPATPYSLLPFFIGAGQNMGILVVVTLDQGGAAPPGEHRGHLRLLRGPGAHRPAGHGPAAPALERPAPGYLRRAPAGAPGPGRAEAAPPGGDPPPGRAPGHGPGPGGGLPAPGFAHAAAFRRRPGASAPARRRQHQPVLRRLPPLPATSRAPGSLGRPFSWGW